MKPLLAAVLALLVVTPAAGTASAEEPFEPIFQYQYENVEDYFTAGTDLAFDGDFIYAPQQGPSQGKIHIFERNDEPEEGEAPYLLRGTIPCTGSSGQNDVAVVEPGILAVAYHDSARCGVLADGSRPPAGGGISLHDVSDPANPVFLGQVRNLPGGTHTLTVHPTKPVIFASPGGQANGQGIEQIIDVSDPTNPVVGGTFTQNPAGCHDFTFLFQTGRELGVCVGLTESSIWDVTDPFAPEVISHIVNPLIFFHHSAAVTHDGKYLLIGDEAYAAHECEGGPTGAMFLYDISNPEVPVLVSYFAQNRNDGDAIADSRESWCTAHLFDFIPGTYTLVSSWYTGGLNVIDWSDPMSPREVAAYQLPAGSRTESTNYWSAYWHDGRIYANDRGRGVFEAFEAASFADPEAVAAMPTTSDRWIGGAIESAPAWFRARAGAPQVFTAAPYSCSLRSSEALTVR